MIINERAINEAEIQELIIRERTPTDNTEGAIFLLARLVRNKENKWIIFKTSTTKQTHELAYEVVQGIRGRFPMTMPGHWDEMPEPDLSLL